MSTRPFLVSCFFSSFRATFNFLIRAFALQGNVDGVIETLEKMNAKNMPINLFTYNNLILAFAKDGYVCGVQIVVTWSN